MLLQEEIPAEEAAATNPPPTPESKEGETKGDAVAADPVVPKKKFRKVDLEVSVENHGFTREDIRLALDFEAKLQYEGNVMRCNIMQCDVM